MGEFNPYPFMKRMSEVGLSNQKMLPGDYFDTDGLMICGKCRKRKQTIREVMNPANPNGFTLLKFACECDCDKKKAQEEKARKAQQDRFDEVMKLRSISLMDEKAKKATFERFQENKFNAKNLKLGKRYATCFAEMLAKNQGLLFWGDVGTSKTFLASCIANYLLNQNVPVVMTSFVKIMSEIEKDRDYEADIMAHLQKASLVIFDDLGAERNTNYSIEKVYNIIDSRYRMNLPMIITTNYSLEEMMSEQDIRYKRIFDRIFEACYPMQFTGPSWRKQEASERFDRMQKFLES